MLRFSGTKRFSASRSCAHKGKSTRLIPIVIPLALHVGDMSATCRRHRQMSPNLGRHCVSLRHRRGPDIPNLCHYSRQVQVSPNIRVSYPTIEFLCLNSNNNQEMLCRLDTLADTTFSCVCDMTETCRRHVADTTQNVAIWAQKRHADIRHMELRDSHA